MKSNNYAVRLFRPLSKAGNLISLLLLLTSVALFIIIFNINFASPATSHEIIFLSGWSKNNPARGGSTSLITGGIAISNATRSTLAFFLAHKNNYRLDFEVLSKNLGQDIEASFNRKEFKILKANTEGHGYWNRVSFALPKGLQKKGYNTITFSQPPGQFTPLSYRNIKVSSYSLIDTVFKTPASYLLLFVIIIFWLVYASWFSGISKIGYSRALSIDAFSYFWSVLIYISVSLTLKRFAPGIFKTNIFLLFTFLILLLPKIFQLYRHSERTVVNEYLLEKLDSGVLRKLRMPRGIILACIFIYFTLTILVAGIRGLNLEWIANGIFFTCVMSAVVKLIYIKRQVIK